MKKLFSNIIGRRGARDKSVEELFTASCHNDVNKVAELIEGGVDIHTEDEFALHAAAWWGSKDVVVLLLDNGADPRARSAETVQSAKERGHHDVAEIIEQRIEALKQQSIQPPSQRPR